MFIALQTLHTVENLPFNDMHSSVHNTRMYNTHWTIAAIKDGLSIYTSMHTDNNKSLQFQFLWNTEQHA